MLVCIFVYFFFFFQAEDGIRDKLVTGVQTCALPISLAVVVPMWLVVHPSVPANSIAELVALAKPAGDPMPYASSGRSEEHTSELQSLAYLVCRLLLEKKKTQSNIAKQCRHRIPWSIS